MASLRLFCQAACTACPLICPLALHSDPLVTIRQLGPKLAHLLCSLDLRDIKVVSKLGGTIDDSEMIDGMVFDHKAAKSAGGPTKIENAKIGLIQFQVSPPKTDLENNVIISDYAQMDRILKEERNYILQMIKKIRATGCNVLLIQKSILRDAVTELSLHYLVYQATPEPAELCICITQCA